MAEVGPRTRHAVAATLVACASPALATPFADAIDTLRSNDCGRLGEVVNQHLDTSPAVKYLAGAMYEEGICVERNLETAAKYYAAGDAARNPEAARAMALQYVQGSHLPRSYAKAGAWFRKVFAFTRGPKDDEPSLPRALATVPLAEASAQAQWAGYLTSLGYIGTVSTPYPTQALRDGVEGTFKASVCVEGGSVEVRTVRIEEGPSEGVRVASMRRALEDNLRRTMDGLPRPEIPPPGPACFEQPVRFRIKR